MKPFKQWPVKYRIILIIVIFFIFLFATTSRLHADELSDNSTTTDHIKDAAIEAVTAAVTMAGAAEQAVTGNLATGAALAAIAGVEAGKAYDSIKAAYESYRSNNENNNDDCRTGGDKTPDQEYADHGRD